MKTSIIGYGWVGKAMHKLFPDAYIYSHNLDLNGNSTIEWDSSIGQLRYDINKCDVAFIGVPTPNIKQDKLDTSIVEEVISWCDCPLIVIRSTVNPGDCDRWAKKYNKNIVMQPEYLGETINHPMLDPTERKFLIIGGKPKDRKKLIDLYTTCYNANITIKQVSALEAEIIKITENRAIAFKVAQCQELYDVCEAAKVDYYTIRDAVYGDDPRFNLWWTMIYPEARGFNSKCIPKDIYAWRAWAESVGVNPVITNTILERNEKWI